MLDAPKPSWQSGDMKPSPRWWLAVVVVVVVVIVEAFGRLCACASDRCSDGVTA